MLKRGRAVSGPKLRHEERYERASRLEEARLPALGKTDVAVIPYSWEEHIERCRQVRAGGGRPLARPRVPRQLLKGREDGNHLGARLADRQKSRLVAPL
jgi:hypothetical protein